MDLHLMLMKWFELFLRLQFPVLTGVATYLSLTPKPGAVFEAAPDKFLHVLCWLVLTLSLRGALGPRRVGFWAALGLFAYSVLVECGQAWVPGRYFSALDILANGVGVIIGWSLILGWDRWGPVGFGAARRDVG